MKPKVVYTLAAVAVIALVAFAVLRSTRNAPAPQPAAASPTTAPAAAPPAATAGAEPSAEETKNVPRIEPQDLYGKWQRHEVTVIDVRDADGYLASHIPGALHIPLARVQGEIAYLPKDKPIVFYCT